MNVGKQLELMRKRLERSKPARMVVTLADGEVVDTDPVGAITMLREREIGEIVGVTTDRAEAGYLDVLCRPAPNRRIEDYE